MKRERNKDRKSMYASRYRSMMNEKPRACCELVPPEAERVLGAAKQPSDAGKQTRAVTLMESRADKRGALDARGGG